MAQPKTKTKKPPSQPLPTVTIKGKTWSYRSVSKEEMIRSGNEPDVVALANGSQRRMEFRKDRLAYKTCIHELVHAYIDECHVKGSDLSPAALEEIVCNLMEDWIEVIPEQAKIIFKTLKGA